MGGRGASSPGSGAGSGNNNNDNSNDEEAIDFPKLEGGEELEPGQAGLVTDANLNAGLRRLDPQAGSPPQVSPVSSNEGEVVVEGPVAGPAQGVEETSSLPPPGKIALPTEGGQIWLTTPQLTLSNEDEDEAQAGLIEQQSELYDGTYVLLGGSTTVEQLNQVSQELFGFEFAAQHYAEIINAPPGSELLVAQWSSTGFLIGGEHQDYGNVSAVIRPNGNSGRVELVVEAHTPNWPDVRGAIYEEPVLTEINLEELVDEAELRPDEYDYYEDSAFIPFEVVGPGPGLDSQSQSQSSTGRAFLGRDRGGGLRPYTNEQGNALSKLSDGTKVLAIDAPKLNELSREFFGFNFDPKDYAEVVGAPAGSEITARYSLAYAGISLDVAHPLYKEQERIIHEVWDAANEKYSLEIHHSIWQMSKQAPEGTGTRMFLKAINAYRKYGIRTITTHAVGNRNAISQERGQGMNGYYTWPRFGFNAKIQEEERAKLPKKLGRAENLNQLFKLPGGREWWLKNGATRRMEFDLTAGSDSLETFKEYVKGKRREGWGKGEEKQNEH